MNVVAKRLFLGWAIFTGMMAGIIMVVFPMFDLFPWFRLNGVMWFSGFLAVVLVIVYVIGGMLGYTGGGGGGGTTTATYESKGARRDER